MTLDELRQLDPKEIGSWPIPAQIGTLCLFFALVVLLGYFALWSAKLEELDAGRLQEEELKTKYSEKKAQAVNLEAYKQQLFEIQQSFGALLKQLPTKSEMESLLTEINQAGVGRGLIFDLFRPQQEIKTTEMAELPIEINVRGSYHDLAAFASDIAQLSRIVTLNNIQITPAGTGPNKEAGMLKLVATAKTYRALDSEEAVAIKKDMKGKK
jgi:type IV pilus assembly protein PilO